MYRLQIKFSYSYSYSYVVVTVIILRMILLLKYYKSHIYCCYNQWEFSGRPSFPSVVVIMEHKYIQINVMLVMFDYIF